MDTEAIKLFVPLAAITRYCGFEVQRWTRARASGFRGASEGFGLLVDTTTMLSSIAYYVWLALAIFMVGFLEAVIVYIASGLFVIVFAGITGPDKIWRWLVSLIAVWPLTIWLYWLIL